MAEYIEKRMACQRLVDKALAEQLRDECAEETVKECLHLIRSIPAADVAPVCKNKCTKQENGYSFYVKCTCGAEFNVDSYYWEYFKKCPNCGSKMDEEG